MVNYRKFVEVREVGRNKSWSGVDDSLRLNMESHPFPSPRSQTMEKD